MEIASPEKAGMSSERLGRIAPVMEEFIKDNRLPGIMTLVQRKGHIVHFGKFGMMDIEAGKPMQEDALFRIFSMTKAITSIALMTLYEEGRLSLKDPVSKFIPAFARTKVYAGMGAMGMKFAEQDPPMSVYNLLTHTSGLSYGSFFDHPVEELYRQTMNAIFKRENSLQFGVERVAELPLLFQPGTRWHYSCATDVLGYVVQVIADMPFADFLEKRIFKPLGMVDTGFHVPANKINRLAQLYSSPALFDPVPVPPENTLFIGDVTQPTQCPAGGAGLVSTLADYLQFCKCLLNNGAYEDGRLISRKTLAWMTANHIPDAQMPIKHGSEFFDFGFGLGFRVATHLGRARQLTSVGEYGWDGAARTHFWIDPAEDMLGLLMTQLLPAQKYPVTERFQAMAYAAIVD